MTIQSVRQSGGDGLVKIVFNLPSDGDSFETESLWAEPLPGGLYRLRNVPFFVRGFSECGIIQAVESDGQLKVTGVAERGGHSTYRIFLPKNTTEEQFAQRWIALSHLGCTYERATSRLIAVDVPPKSDVYAVYSVLEQGEHNGLWEFEEGHCGHPLRDGK